MGRRKFLQSQQLLLAWIFIGCFCTTSHAQYYSTSSVLKVGALICLNSRSGKSIKMALELAMEKVNEDRSFLDGTKLELLVSDSNCTALQSADAAMQLMDDGVIAILGPQASDELDFAATMAEAAHIPLISFLATDPALSQLEYPYFTRVVPSDTMQMDAISSIIDYYGWKDVVALFTDDDLGRNGFFALRNALERVGSRIAYKVALDPKMGKFGIHKVLLDLSKIESKVFVVHVQPDLGQTLLSVAVHLGMFNASYVWIITDGIVSILDIVSHGVASLRELENIIGTRMYIPPSVRFKYLYSELKRRLGHAHDGDQFVSLGAFYAYDALWVFAKAAHSLMNQKKHGLSGGTKVYADGPMLLHQILETRFSGITGLIEFDAKGDRLHSVFEIVNKVENGFKAVGYWSIDTRCLTIWPPIAIAGGLFNATKKAKGPSLVTLRGRSSQIPHGLVGPTIVRHLHIIVPNKAGFQQFVEIRVDRHNKTIASGFCIDVFRTAVSYLPYNVSYTFTAFGTGQSTPIYDDLIQKVADKDFDTAVGDITITNKRSKIVRFTQPFLDSGLAVIVPKMLPRSSRTWQFLQPFTISMWSAMGALFIFTGVILWILEHKKNRDFQGRPKKQIATTLWFILSTLFFTHREKVKSVLGRTALIVWLFVVLIITSSYTANLTSILTIEQLSPMVDGIAALVTSDVPIGYQSGSFARDYLLELGVAKDRLVPLNSLQNYTTALLNGPQRGGVAAIVDERPYAELFIAQGCDFQISGQDFSKDSWGFAFQKGSQLAVDISTAILNLTGSGELDRIRYKWLANSTCKSSDEFFSHLGITSFLGLFMITGLVSTLASIAYCIRLALLFCDVRRTNESLKPPEGLSKYARSMHYMKSFVKFITEKEIPRNDRKIIKKMSRLKKEEKRQRAKDASASRRSLDDREEDGSFSARPRAENPSFNYGSDIKDNSVNCSLHRTRSLS